MTTTCLQNTTNSPMVFKARLCYQFAMASFNLMSYGYNHNTLVICGENDWHNFKSYLKDVKIKDNPSSL